MLPEEFQFDLVDGDKKAMRCYDLHFLVEGMKSLYTLITSMSDSQKPCFNRPRLVCEEFKHPDQPFTCPLHQ